MLQNKDKEVWFKTDSLTARKGIIKKWVYDQWYEILDNETKVIFFVLPEFIKYENNIIMKAKVFEIENLSEDGFNTLSERIGNMNESFQYGVTVIDRGRSIYLSKNAILNNIIILSK